MTDDYKSSFPSADAAENSETSSKTLLLKQASENLLKRSAALNKAGSSLSSYLKSLTEQAFNSIKV